MLQPSRINPFSKTNILHATTIDEHLHQFESRYAHNIQQYTGKQGSPKPVSSCVFWPLRTHL